MARILFISYGIEQVDGRLRELVKISNRIGETDTITCSYTKRKGCVFVKKEKYLSPITYIHFFIKCFFKFFSIKHYDILFVDNFFACPPAIFLKAFNKKMFVIQDSRELYYYEDIKSRFGRFCCKKEVALFHKSNIILCANEFRASIMKKRYKLESEPIVFENIRFFDKQYDSISLNKKYNDLFTDKYKIVDTGGISIERGSLKVIKAFEKLSDEYHLYIVGGATEKDLNDYRCYINEKHIKNITYLEKVPLSELRYIVSKCDAGLVYYHKNDDNNIYCASGKIYEYLGERLPVITSDNITLASFCNKYQVGVSNPSFYDGIKIMFNNFDYYKRKVELFMSTFNQNEYINSLVEKINNSIGDYCG